MSRFFFLEIPPEPEVEVDEPQVVNEIVEKAMMPATTTLNFAETPRTESLFQLMQQDDLEKASPPEYDISTFKA